MSITSRRTNRCIGKTKLGVPCANPVSGSSTLCGRCATSLAGIHNQVSVFKIAKQGGWRSVKPLDRHYRRSGTFENFNPATDKQRRRKEGNVAGHSGVPAEGESAEDHVEAELPEDPTEAASP